MTSQIQSGTSPQIHSRDAALGRFTKVKGAQRTHLFIPETRNLFSIPEEVSVALKNYESETFDQNLPGLKPGEIEIREFISNFIKHENIATPEPTSPPLQDGLRDLVLNISQICNLNCTYCYATDLNKAGRVMLPDTSRAAIDRALSLSNGGLSSLKFLGGEPTLAFPEIQAVVKYIEKRSAELDFQLPSYVIVTNGTKLTDVMIEYFCQHDFYVLISIDGPKQIHDLLRPFSGGRGSYEKVVGVIERFFDRGKRVAVEAVYTKTHYSEGVRVQDLVSHFLDLGIREMQITLALGSWHGEGAYNEISEVASDFANAARGCIRSFSSEDPYLIRGIQFVIDGFVNRKKNEHVCGAGRTFMAVNYDGEAFPCYLLESKETSYGFVNGDWDDDKYKRISSAFYRNGKKYHEVCGNCWANEICQSCLGSTFLIEKKIAKPPAWFCAVQKTLISAVLGEIGEALSGPDKERFIMGLENALKPRSFER